MEVVEKMSDFGLFIIAASVYFGLKAVAESIESAVGDLAELLSDEDEGEVE